MNKRICPNCYSDDIKGFLSGSMIFGPGPNKVDYYSCNKCGVMFKDVKNVKEIEQIEDDDKIDFSCGDKGVLRDNIFVNRYFKGLSAIEFLYSMGIRSKLIFAVEYPCFGIGVKNGLSTKSVRARKMTIESFKHLFKDKIVAMYSVEINGNDNELIIRYIDLNIEEE